MNSIPNYSINAPNASSCDLYRWIKHFQLFGQLPCETKRLRHRCCTTRLEGDDIIQLKHIAEESPHLYLDEMQENLFLRTGHCYALSTIHRSLQTLGLTLQVLTARATQQDEICRSQFLDAIRRYDTHCLLFVDETHKGRNDARRRRGWGVRGQQNCVSEIFDPMCEHRFTLLAADQDGFLPQACQLVQRKMDPNDDDLTLGTVDTDGFLFWTRRYLLPCLGNFLLNEARSVVVIDNATIHHSPEFEQLVQSVGAIVLYTAPFSPDLMPIEYCFHVYKASLKRNSNLTRARFWDAHMDALASVDRSMMVNFMRNCGLDVEIVDDDLEQCMLLYALIEEST